MQILLLKQNIIYISQLLLFVTLSR